MLSLAPPYYRYGNVVLGRDYGDPAQFYLFPNAPRIARTEDGKPAILLLVFRQDLDDIPEDADEAVGFLSLDVDLGYTDEEIDAAKRKLVNDLNLTVEPKIAPMLYRHGSVRLLLLDEKSKDPSEKETGKPSEFVLKVLGSASPSLYGDNRATFQAMLSKKGTAALSGALTGFTPIGVVYELAFSGLQPAYRIKVSADWHKVYTHWSEREDYNSIWYEHEVLKAIDNLIENRTIVVDDVIEGVDEEGMKADHDSVMNDLRKYILDTFFKATLDKEAPAGADVAGKITTTLRDIAAIPFSMFGKYTYQRKEMTTDELRSLDIDWSVRKAVERTIYPQGHISTLLSFLPVTKDEIIHVVNGRDDLWRTIAVDVSADAAWDLDGIAAVTVDVQYGAGTAASSPSTWSFTLTKDKTREKRRAWLDPAVGDALQVRYVVVFAAGATSGTELKLDSGWLDHKGTVIVIQPRELYRVVEAELVAASNFPFDRVLAVHAYLRYRAEGGFTFVDDALLLADKRKLAVRFRAPLDVEGQTEIRYEYSMADGRVIDPGWMPLVGSMDVIKDPEPKTLSVRVIPTGDRKKIASLIIDFEYRDDESGLFETGGLVFDETNIAKPQEWSCRISDVKKRRYRYRTTLVYNASGNNELVQTGWIESEAPTLPVGEVFFALLGVEVSLQGKAEGVERVTVRLQYDDDAGNVHESRNMTFQKSGETAAWEVKLKSLDRQTYTYSVVWVMEDGFDRKIGPIETTTRFLAIPGKPPSS